MLESANHKVGDFNICAQKKYLCVSFEIARVLWLNLVKFMLLCRLCLICRWFVWIVQSKVMLCLSFCCLWDVFLCRGGDLALRILCVLFSVEM